MKSLTPQIHVFRTECSGLAPAEPGVAEQPAVDACALSLGMPNFLIPVTAPNGSIATPTEQKARWQAGLDPRTGLPAAAVATREVLVAR
ncbi:hypothetical protein GCM10009543_28560 [Leifsonia naganoensis]